MSVLVKTSGNGGLFPTSIYIAATPYKAEFIEGEELDITGMIVKARYNNGDEKDITDEIVTTPEIGEPLEFGETRVEITYTYSRAIFTAYQDIIVKADVELVSWSAGTNEQIVKMLDAHYKGKIDVTKIWAVGDERKINLSAIGASATCQAQPEQEVTLVLLNVGGYELSTGGECAFKVGHKNCLNSRGKMHTEQGSQGYSQCTMRTYLNSDYRNALPEDLRPIFKSFRNKTGKAGGGAVTTEDYFTVATEKELSGEVTAAWLDTETDLQQIEYYKVVSNRIKRLGDAGAIVDVWTSSTANLPYTYYTVLMLLNGIEYSAQFSNGEWGICPQGCI